MACSKIFSGDLPELVNEIIQYFHHDYKTLHSCILINRLWCRLAIPLLWENPFSIRFLKNYHFIKIYLYNLNDDDKTKLNEYGINNDLIPSNTLFNYPSFIKHLVTHEISSSIKNWEASVRNFSYPIQNTNFIKFIYRLLFQIFIEKEVNLHSFEIVLFSSLGSECVDDILKLILQNPNFLRNIKFFKLEGTFLTAKTLAKFSKILNSNCNSVSSLYFKFPYSDNNQMMEKCLSQIINSQENLRKILFGSNYFPLYHSLLSLKNSNCSNTLNTIIFYLVDFKNITVLNEVFNQLNVLESIHIIYCCSIDIKFVQQITNVTKPFKLKSLILHETLQNESLELLIQKFGNDIEDFGIKVTNVSLQLLESVIIYCCKIKFLYILGALNSQNINFIFNLIENIKQNLNYLIIEHQYKHMSSIILQNLGQILPFKLEYLNLSLVTNISDLETFLKNSQNTFIKKLAISNTIRDISEDTFPYIEEYIMKKKRVKYLAVFQKSFLLTETCKNLIFLKDKVDEYKLYDIQVLDYASLYYFDVGNFIYNKII